MSHYMFDTVISDDQNSDVMYWHDKPKNLNTIYCDVLGLLQLQTSADQTETVWIGPGLGKMYCGFG